MKYVVLSMLFIGSVNAKTMEFGSINFLMEQEVGRIVLPKIYQKLGLTINITPLPAKRAQRDANSGIRDGEIMRIYTYGLENKNVIRVPTPYYFLHTCAFTLATSDIQLNALSDLSSHQLAKVRGVKHTNNATRGMKNVSDSDNTREIMNLVSSGLADVALTNKMDGLNTLKKFQTKRELKLNKCFTKWDLFHYLHKKHKALVPLLNQEIKQMESSGELATIIAEAEDIVLNSLERNKQP